jgi:hypothetical protein
MISHSHESRLGWCIALTVAAFVAFFGVCVYLLKLGLEFIE